MSDQTPRLIVLPEVQSKGGFLSFAESNNQIPFDVKRTYWSYGQDQEVVRGNHFHSTSKRVVVAFSGTITVELESTVGQKHSYRLTKPSEAVYIPENHWVKMIMSADSVLMALASCTFENDEVNTSYDAFQALNNG